MLARAANNEAISHFRSVLRGRETKFSGVRQAHPPGSRDPFMVSGGSDKTRCFGIRHRCRYHRGNVPATARIPRRGRAAPRRADRPPGQGAVAAAGLEPRACPHPPGPQRRRAAEPAHLGAGRRGDPAVPERAGTRCGDRARRGPPGRRAAGTSACTASTAAGTRPGTPSGGAGREYRIGTAPAGDGARPPAVRISGPGWLLLAWLTGRSAGTGLAADPPGPIPVRPAW